RLLIRRSVPTPKSGDEVRLAVSPYPGGPESAVTTTGRVVSARWIGSVTISVYTITGSGPQLARVDVRNSAASQALQLPDSAISDAVALPNGWAWIPGSHDRVIVEQNGKAHQSPKRPRSGHA